MKIKFYDTSSLLAKTSRLWKDNEQIVISSTTLKELENIKTSANKDADIKFASRKLITELINNPDKYEVFPWHMEYYGDNNDYEINNDLKIILCANAYFKEHTEGERYFVSNDLHCRVIAEALFEKDIIVESYIEEPYDYKGYREIQMDDNQMAEMYSDLEKNPCDLLVNEYLIIKDSEGEIVDKMCWTGERLRPVQYYTFSSSWFGDVKPIKNDIHQVLAFDSLMNNKITMLKGRPGSGKSVLSLSFLFHKLEKGKIDKIVIFCNPVATNNSARLGFYPGTKNDKLLDSQIGNFLSAKLGSQLAVQRLIDDEKLVLVPLADIRGYDTSGMNAGVYITEAQNMDVELMKLALQRIGEDCICVLDGDYDTQVDLADYQGANNGMRRASEVFRGADFYGEVLLNTIHRGRIAQLAENM